MTARRASRARTSEVPAPWRSRIVGREEVAPGTLLPHPKNWRKHPRAQIEALEGVLTEVGWVQDTIVSRRTGRLLDGHARVELALQRGELKVPVVYVDVTEEEEALVLASLDPISAMATTDPEKLKALLGEAKANGEALKALLTDLAMRAGVGSEPKDGLADPDAVPEPPEEPKTRPGDLVTLGDHRLLCGDSAKPDDLDRLLAGDTVQLLATDPPYNVSVEPRSAKARAVRAATSGRGKPVSARGRLRAKDRPLENDHLPDEEFARLLRAWFGNASRVLEPGRSFYVWGGYSNAANYPPALAESNLHFSQAIIWVKEHPVMTRKDFMGNHEWCFYGWREGAAHYFVPGVHNATDVWSVKKVSPQSMVHLTEKPVELAVRALRFSSRPGEVVLDLFAGSGSTLIAAEQMGRRARLLEIDPAYCDVIVERFERFSGKKAEVHRG